MSILKRWALLLTFSRRPVVRSSMTATSCPAVTYVSTTWDPMNPAPPVTTIVIDGDCNPSGSFEGCACSGAAGIRARGAEPGGNPARSRGEAFVGPIDGRGSHHGRPRASAPQPELRGRGRGHGRALLRRLRRPPGRPGHLVADGGAAGGRARPAGVDR